MPSRVQNPRTSQMSRNGALQTTTVQTMMWFWKRGIQLSVWSAVSLARVHDICQKGADTLSSHQNSKRKEWWGNTVSSRDTGVALVSRWGNFCSIRTVVATVVALGDLDISLIMIFQNLSFSSELSCYASIPASGSGIFHMHRRCFMTEL